MQVRRRVYDAAERMKSMISDNWSVITCDRAGDSIRTKAICRFTPLFLLL